MLLPEVRRRAVDGSRRVLEIAVQKRAFRRVAERTIAELNRAVDVASNAGVYGGEYFGEERDSLDRMGLSGYERYDRDTSNANAAAYMIWRHFPVKRTLDVGCASGFVVEALRELGLDARGTDISRYAIQHPAQGAAGFLEWGDLMAGLPYKNGQFELITCLETLEHMEPEMIPAVLSELRRVTSKYVVCTIPSFGPNAYGPGGWFDIKVKPEKLDEYNAKGPEYTGPVPHEDLYRDMRGNPIEGHLTIASFDWWTEQFEKAGFVRCGQTELSIHPSLARFGLTEYWNLYIFRAPEATEPTGDVQTSEAIAHWEENFKLNNRGQRLRDYERLNEALERNGQPPLAIPAELS